MLQEETPRQDRKKRISDTISEALLLHAHFTKLARLLFWFQFLSTIFKSSALIW